MSTGYFHRVAQETPTRIWVNNPSIEENTLAIEAGAISCTTNPSYCSKLLSSDPDHIRAIIDAVIQETDDNDHAAELVYKRAVQPILEEFLPLYEASAGKQGFVTVQGDPRLDEDAEAIIEESLRYRELGENYMAKIPCNHAGILAIEKLVTMNVPICATEIFSVAQAVYVCELYEKTCQDAGVSPPFFVTHITGIFDQLWQSQVKAEHIDIAPELLEQAGTVVARKQHHIIRERGYSVGILGGGARNLEHFTEIVGGDFHVTLNWRDIKALIDEDRHVANRIDVELSEAEINELIEKLPNFRRAYFEDAHTPEQFTDFGPLVFFRTMFLNGYARLLDEIINRRALLQ